MLVAASAFARGGAPPSATKAASAPRTQGAPHDAANHPPEDVGPSKPEEVEAEVRDNILAQSIGPATIADLKLPEDFLRRVTDRVVRASYEERYRIVVRDETSTAPRASEPPPASTWSRMIWIGIGALVVTLVVTVWTQRRKTAQ